MKYLLFLSCILLLCSCEQSGTTEYKSSARGSADELVVVVDSAVWAGSVGHELRRIFEAPMQGMPQDEPLFQVYQINPLKLNSVLKSVYNMIFVTTLDSRTSQSKELQKMFTNESLKRIQRDPSIFQVTENDKFANGQKTMFLFGHTSADLAKKLSQNRQPILNVFEKRAREITRGRVLKTRATDIEKVIKTNHGYSIQIPFGWDLAKDQLDFIWCRELDHNREKNIFIYQQPYKGPQDFNTIVDIRDKIGELHLRDSQVPELFITRQDMVPVVTKRTSFNDKFAMEARGLWAVSDMTAGGPFLSYTLVDEENAMLYYMEGYVYNPGGKKKRLMREMDAILSTFTVPSEVKK